MYELIDATSRLTIMRNRAPGAVVVEWNVKQPTGQTGATGMWDSHIRQV